jgi:hypothetical protein
MSIQFPDGVNVLPTFAIQVQTNPHLNNLSGFLDWCLLLLLLL